MKAKLVKEDLQNIFKGKSNEEIEESIKKSVEDGSNVSAEILEHIIKKSEIGYYIKVNFDGAWDRFGKVKDVKVLEINKGNGLEKGLLVQNEHGSFLYRSPFRIEALPTNDSMFLFFAGRNSIYINSLIKN